MGWVTMMLAALGAALFAWRARWSPAKLAASAAATGCAAWALRWVIIETLSPAYPELAPTLIGPGVAAVVLATTLVWVARDHAR